MSGPDEQSAKCIRYFGLTVSLPGEYDVPLETVAPDVGVDLSVVIGALSSHEKRHTLDDAVELLYADRTVAVNPVRRLGPLALQHYIIDHAVPNGLSWLGYTVVHGACVATVAGAVLLLGRSGAGKSTTSAYLLSKGLSLLGDDAVRLVPDAAGPRVCPSYCGVRLHPDVLAAKIVGPVDVEGRVAEYSNKQRLRVDARVFQQYRTPLRLIVELAEDAAFEVRELGPAQRCAAIARHQFGPPTDLTGLQSKLDAAIESSLSVAGYSVAYPRTRAGLDVLASWLIQRLG